MTQEQLEFAITQYLDGTLPPEDLAALEQRLAADPEARALLEEHQKLTALLRSDPVPAMAWDELAGDLRAVVTGTVDQEAKAQDQKLNGLLKSAVPPLPIIRWDALTAHISAAIDRDAAVRDEQDDALDNALRSLPTPAVNWDRLAGHISDAVAREAERAERRDELREQTRAKVFSLKWVRTASQLAVAACVVIASLIGIRAYMNRDSTDPTIADRGRTSNAVAIVELAAPESSKATAVAEITIGPSPTYARLEEEERNAAARAPIVIALPAPETEEADRPYGMFE